MGIGYIYLITNLINGKKYIGQTRTTIEERWNKHCSHSKDPKRAIGVDGAIRKYGANNFQCEKIKECPIEELDKWEIYYIKEYNTYQGDNADIGYNLTLGGQGGLLYDIDEDEMLQMYLNGMTAVEIAKYYGCSDKTIGNRLKKYNVNTKQHHKEWVTNHPEIWKENLNKGIGKPFQKGDTAKPVYLIELDKSFSSLEECSKWLLENNYTKAASWEAVRKSLSRHLNGERDSYLKMHFKFI